MTNYSLSFQQSAKQEAAKRIKSILAKRGVLPRADFINPDPVAWMLENFYVPETPDKRLILHPYQIACLREALRRDEKGDFVYSVIVWSDCKKSIKSTISAAVALWMAFQTPWGSVKIVANDLKQADSRAAYYARRAIELNPRLKEIARVKPSGYLIELPNHSRLEAIPVDPKGEAGGNDDAVIYSELWAADSKAAQRLWTETTLSPTKYGKSFRWVETYAGFSGESPILEQLYLSGVKEGERLNLGDFSPELEVYANKAARLFCLWNTTPRLSWQTPEYYAQESATLTPNEFLRVHRNQWVSSVDKFVPDEWWRACQGAVPKWETNQVAVVAMDAAISGDCFAMVVVTCDGPNDNRRPCVQYARAWKPPKGGKLDFRGTPDEPGPEIELRRILERYYVAEIAYDPYQLEDLASRLSSDLLGQFYAFSQGQERAVADKRLYDMIRDRRLVHNGDPVLAEHIQNANRKTEGDKMLRIVKRSENMKIDAAVALSMAVDRAMFWSI